MRPGEKGTGNPAVDETDFVADTCPSGCLVDVGEHAGFRLSEDIEELPPGAR